MELNGSSDSFLSHLLWWPSDFGNYENQEGHFLCLVGLSFLF